MRLRKLVLHGFKSFADRTEFTFDSPITGIVGPNGCGKSNVVDAFKWVLGEQSAKSLRGDAMLDVIFNGAASRKASAMAEVVLVFDNPILPVMPGGGSDSAEAPVSRRLLPLDVDEVSVGRRLYRDSTSEYTLNGKSARLKDIRELFMDTGVGVDAYSVIEQGRVAQLLDANPVERRQIFEEAAGISKFKQRKKESQRKLEKVDQNLLRVTDVVDEVERRLRGVRVQAGRARVYQEHSTRLAELRLDLALKEYHTFATDLAQVESALADARFRLADSETDVTRAAGELTTAREAEQAAVAARQQAEYELIELSGQIDRARQAEEFATRQLHQTREQIAVLEQEAAAGGERLEKLTAQLEQERARLAEVSAEVESRQAEIQSLQESFKQGQLRLNQLTQEQEKHKAAVLDAMRKHAQAASRLGGIEIERRNLAQQEQRQSERRKTLVADLETNEVRRAELDEKLKEAAADIAARQTEADAAKAEAQQLGKQLAQLTEDLSSAKQHRSALQGRQKVLQDLEQRQQGVSEGVKTVLRRREKEFPFVRGLVADVLRVDIEHARVIEAALDGRDQWLVVASVAEAVTRSGEFAKLEGRVNFVSAEPWPSSAFDAACVAETNTAAGEVSPPQPEPVAQGANPAAFYIRHPTSDVNHFAEELAASPVPVRLAMDLVRFEPAYGPVARRLLSRIAIVDDLASAEQLRISGPIGWRYVTPAGEVLDTDGTLHAGPPTAAMGLMSRRSELEQLAAQIGEIERRIADLSAELAGANQLAKSLEQKQSDLRQQVYQANTRRVEISSSLGQVNDRINLLRREQPLLDRELASLGEQQQRLTAEEQALSQRKAEIERQQAESQQSAEQAAAQHQQLAESLRGEGERLAGARVAIAEFQQRQIAARQHEQRLAAQVSELKQQLDRLAQQATQATARMESAEQELEQARHRQQVLTGQKRELQERANQLTEKVAALSAAVGEAAERVDATRASHSEIDQEASKLAMREGELRVRIETVVARTGEELQLDLPARYAELVAVLPEGTTFSPADRDWPGVVSEIAELREKIHRLGNVNLDAIGEQDELEKRSQFLSKELTDLRDAKKQLETLIDEINAESSVRFQKTFETVREHFQGMFRKLFGGGKADLHLETEVEVKAVPGAVNSDGSPAEGPRIVHVDPLDAGIEVIARPPGKQPVRISQLSGGEKTMTCVALLLSIFKSKPSPFCILDEVDAALDEANNQRFNLIVQEFLDQSQFIVITHSKRTMTIADQLYGITQQEQGVSRRVAVRFDQVGRDGKIDSQAVREQDQRDRSVPAPAAPHAARPEPREREVVEEVAELASVA